MEPIQIILMISRHQCIHDSKYQIDTKYSGQSNFHNLGGMSQYSSRCCCHRRTNSAIFQQPAKELLNEYNVWTGYSLAHEWQKHNGILANESRLMPQTPFVCGGRFELGVLVAINAISGMRSRANLARQIFDLPDGAQIEFKIIE